MVNFDLHTIVATFHGGPRDGEKRIIPSVVIGEYISGPRSIELVGVVNLPWDQMPLDLTIQYRHGTYARVHSPGAPIAYYRWMGWDR